MPIYEYVCSECGHEFELMQKMSDSPTQECEKCNKKKAKRVISQTSFMLKGSGWYATDYGGKKSHGTSSSAPSCASSDSCPSKSCPSKKAS